MPSLGSGLRSVATAGLLLLAPLVSVRAFPVTFGDGSSANCAPFSCLDLEPLARYQQVYEGLRFGGPVTISSFTVYGVEPAPGTPFGRAFSAATFDVYLARSSQTPGTLTGDPAANISGGRQLFVSFSGSGVQWSADGQAITFVGTPYLFDPTGGENLLMDVVVRNTPVPGTAFLEFGPGGTGRAFYLVDGRWGVTPDGGLRTTFEAAQLTAVPEPAMVALLGGGLLPLGMWRLSRRRAR